MKVNRVIVVLLIFFVLLLALHLHKNIKRENMEPPTGQEAKAKEPDLNIYTLGNVELPEVMQNDITLTEIEPGDIASLQADNGINAVIVAGSSEVHPEALASLLERRFVLFFRTDGREEWSNRLRSLIPNLTDIHVSETFPGGERERGYLWAAKEEPDVYLRGAGYFQKGEFSEAEIMEKMILRARQWSERLLHAEDFQIDPQWRASGWLSRDVYFSCGSVTQWQRFLHIRNEGTPYVASIGQTQFFLEDGCAVRSLTYGGDLDRYDSRHELFGWAPRPPVTEAGNGTHALGGELAAPIRISTPLPTAFSDHLRITDDSSPSSEEVRVNIFYDLQAKVRSFRQNHGIVFQMPGRREDDGRYETKIPLFLRTALVSDQRGKTKDVETDFSTRWRLTFEDL